MLLTRALDDYFPPAREGSPFLVALGETARHADLRLNWDAESAWTVTAQAWRSIQMVLMRQERLHLGEFTLFDTETTSSVPLTAEIMEIAAVRVRDRSVLNETFCARIRPSSPDAIRRRKTHGISWQMVANERTADEVIPEFLEFVGDRIVAGHNIVSFDSRILDRECQRLELDSPTVFQIDTLQLARRLRPRQRNAR
ncbi:MAG: 3'-5' exonuclease [Thermomicrobiales bacterium]